MGSLAPEPVDEKREINVLVTGFGPFLDNGTNPSYLIARSLPPKHTLPNLPPINIHTHPTPLEVSYDTILKTVPRLLFTPQPPPAPDRPNYDIVLTLGMASGRTYYALETTAHRSHYTKPDIHGRIPAPDPWRDDTPPPELLLSTFHTEDVWRRWKSALVAVDLRTSNDPGRYLCDFIYYACMFEYWRRERGGGRPCMFLHVPGGCGEEDVRRGGEVALGLIAAIVGSEMAREGGEKDVGRK